MPLHTSHLKSLALTGTALAALSLAAAQPAAAIIAVVPPINATFSGTGTVAATTVGGYNTQFLGTSTSVVNFSLDTFTGDSISLYYTPTPVVSLFLQAPSNSFQAPTVSVLNTFTGTDILTVANGRTVDLSLTGTFTGPTGAIAPVGGAVITFTGTATVTGGTLGLTGSTPFSATETQVAALAPGSIFAPSPASNPQPAGSASYTASYGTLAPPVPEASTTVSFGLLLALGVSGLVVASRRKKQSA